MAAQTSPVVGKPINSPIYPALTAAIDHILTTDVPTDAPAWASIVMSGTANKLRSMLDNPGGTPRIHLERCVLRWFLADLAARNNPQPKESPAARVYRILNEVRS